MKVEEIENLYSFKIVTCEVVERGYERCLKLFDELKKKTVEERMSLYSQHKKWFSSREMIDLESLVVNPRPSSLERFRLWFHLIGSEFLVGSNAGQWDYVKFLKMYPKKGMNSYKFPHMVLLSFSMLGYIDGLRSNYSNSKTIKVDGLSGFGRKFWLNLPKIMGFIEDEADWFSGKSNNGWSAKMDRVVSFEIVDDTWSSYPEWQAAWQKKSIEALTMTPEAETFALQTLKKLDDDGIDIFQLQKKEKKKRLSKIDKEVISGGVNAYMLNLAYTKLKLGDIGTFKVDKYAGRCYTIITNLSSTFRHKYLKLEGEEVAEVDVGSAQPFFLGLRVLREKDVKSVWLDACLNYDFYLCVKKVTGFKGDRKQVKQYIMRYLFSCNKGKTYKPQFFSR